MSKTTKKRVIYKPEIVATAKAMFVQEGKSALQIAEALSGPTHQTISNWARQNRAKKGEPLRNWITEREEHINALYVKLSPKQQAQKFLDKIDRLLAKPTEDFDTKDADALSKLHKAMQDILDDKYQLPMMFQVLGDLIGFLKLHYGELVTEQFVNAIRHFKNLKMQEAGN